jgi:MFS family permease
MGAATEFAPVTPEKREPVLGASNCGRAFGGFFLTGVLFSFSGAILPVWGCHLRSDYSTISLYFLFLTFGIYAGSQIARWMVARTGLRVLLVAGSGLASLGLLALAFVSGPQPPSYRMFGLFVVGMAGAMVNSGLFHALAPAYEHDKAATINLSGAMFGMGCLATAFLTACTIETLSAQNVFILLAAIPAYFTFGFWRGGPVPYFPRPERS